MMFAIAKGSFTLSDFFLIAIAFFISQKLDSTIVNGSVIPCVCNGCCV